MNINVHPITKILSAAILLAVGVLIMPSPLIPAALAEPPLECEEFDPGHCIEECCDDYDTCVGIAQSAYNSCIQDCEFDPEPQDCEARCESALEINQELCTGDAEFCIFWCGI